MSCCINRTWLSFVMWNWDGRWNWNLIIIEGIWSTQTNKKGIVQNWIKTKWKKLEWELELTERTCQQWGDVGCMYTVLPVRWCRSQAVSPTASAVVPLASTPQAVDYMPGWAHGAPVDRPSQCPSPRVSLLSASLCSPSLSALRLCLLCFSCSV